MMGAHCTAIALLTYTDKSTAAQLWEPTTLGNPEDGGDMFSETSIPNRAIGNKVPEGIRNKKNKMTSSATLRRVAQEQHCVTSQKTAFFIVTALKTSNLTKNNL
jgi:hypothetical protein